MAGVEVVYAAIAWSGWLDKSLDRLCSLGDLRRERSPLLGLNAQITHPVSDSGKFRVPLGDLEQRLDMRMQGLEPLSPPPLSPTETFEPTPGQEGLARTGISVPLGPPLFQI